MLDRRQFDLGQIEHLPGPMANIDTVTQITVTSAADPGNVIDDLVGHRDLRQMPAIMAGLAARLAARRAPQALGLRFGKTIRGRRPRRVAGVLRQPPLQLNNLGLKPLDRRRLLNHQSRKLVIRRAAQGHITQFAAANPTPTPPEQSP